MAWQEQQQQQNGTKYKATTAKNPLGMGERISMLVAQVLSVSSIAERAIECWKQFYAYFHFRGLGSL
jgi:hypothetical protein